MTGILPLLKPPGMTSQNAVSHVKALLQVRKAGHAGTLDPGAAGVLPVMLGRATKLSAHLMHAPKAYIAEMQVGVETDTLDTYGTVISESRARFDAASLRDLLPSFTGEILQVPPAYAAIKLRGKPLYALAREGRCPELPARRVVIDALELLHAGSDRFLLRIACGHGTYVRALIRDLAHALGTVAVTSFLLRTEAAGFTVQDAVTFTELARMGPDLVRAPEEVLALPRLDVPPYLYAILDSGTPIDPGRTPHLHAAGGQAYLLWCRGEFFGIGQLTERGLTLTVRLKLPRQKKEKNVDNPHGC